MKAKSAKWKIINASHIQVMDGEFEALIGEIKVDLSNTKFPWLWKVYPTFTSGHAPSIRAAHTIVETILKETLDYRFPTPETSEEE